MQDYLVNLFWTLAIGVPIVVVGTVFKELLDADVARRISMRERRAGAAKLVRPYVAPDIALLDSPSRDAEPR